MTAADALAAYRHDLGLVIERIIGSKLSSKQRELVKVMSARNARLAVRTGHGVGKTYAAALLALAFCVSYPESRVVTTAPTWLQVRDLLWSEINRAWQHSKSPLGGEIGITRLAIRDGWFAVGLSTDDPTRFQGHHAPNILVIFDEAPGVGDDIWDAAESLMASGDARWLVIGNPVSATGRFRNCFKAGAAWQTMHWSCLDAPNVVGEMDVPGGVTQEWIDSMRKRWGEESPVFKSRVLGEFPTEDEDNVLVPMSWILQAQERKVAAAGVRKLGVDVARYGRDSTVLCVRRGRVIERIVMKHNIPTTETAGLVRQIMRDMSIAPADVTVDDTGLGGGVTDSLHEQEIMVHPCNFGSSADDKERFENAKAEVYWRLREALDPTNPEALALPDDEMLAGDLCQSYRLTSRGKIAIESKDHVTARIGRSPDKGDALALTYAAREEAVVPRITVF